MIDHAEQKPRGGFSGQEVSDTSGERVAKALARAGVASRRDVEKLIESGRVALNGKVLSTPAVKVEKGDILTVDGAVVGEAEAVRVWRYHKPVGLVTTHKDPKGRPTVFEHLPQGLPRVISVGRLDLASEGLLLLTNDGDLTRALELPSNGWVRRYRARAYGRITQDKLDKLKDGVTVEGVHYGPIEARLDKVQDRSGDDGRGPANLWISISLTEGKNREVRRVLEHLGVKVNRLIRLAYGPFALGTLAVGEVEEVGPRVIREQLADQIPPERMPKGDRRVALPQSAEAVAPGRRGATPPKARANAGEPRRGGRPGRAGSEAGAAPEKKLYKPGWAKPKRKPSPAPKSSAGKPPRRPRSPKGS